MIKALVEILGIIMVVFEILVILSDKKKKVIFYNYMINVLSGIQYYLLHAYTGFLSIFVTFIRNYVFEYYYNKKKKTPVIWLLLILLFLAAVQVSSYNGLVTTIPLVTFALYTYAIWQDDMKVFKYFHVPIYFLSIIYYLYYGVLINTITNSIFLLLSMIEIVHGSKKKKKLRKKS